MAVQGASLTFVSFNDPRFSCVRNHGYGPSDRGPAQVRPLMNHGWTKRRHGSHTKLASTSFSSSSHFALTPVAPLTRKTRVLEEYGARSTRVKECVASGLAEKRTTNTEDGRTAESLTKVLTRRRIVMMRHSSSMSPATAGVQVK